MEFLNFELYKPSDVERWISDHYYVNGILTPSDLTVKSVAELFGIELRYHEGPCFAEWNDEEGYAFIFLDSRKSPVEQKNIFFHELCHPLRHAGDQDRLPILFQQLQETQAAQFQAVAALPVFLLRQVPVEPLWINYVHLIAEAFGQPVRFVELRLQQIKARIEQEHSQQMRMQSQLKKAPVFYSETTTKLLEQLHRQKAEKGVNYSVGY